MKNEITKEMLEKLYSKEGKSTHEIARILGCSSETIANRCREYGIKLKGQGSSIRKRKKKIDKVTLERLYVREKKTFIEITKILGCSYSNVRNYCLEYGMQLRKEYKKRDALCNNKDSDNERPQRSHFFSKTA